MKIKSLIFFASISVILSGLATIVYISVWDMQETVRLFDKNQPNIPENFAVASMSKGTIILLLAVGVIGVLGVSRKKKDTVNSGPDMEKTKNFRAEESE